MPSPSPKDSSTTLRIIGGKLRGSRIQYTGDRVTRPMKDRVREAVFNLVGPAIKGTFAIDLFAGTGAIAIEAISRGAIGAIAIERHFPSARVIRSNAADLQIADQVEVVASDTFFWARDLPTPTESPWSVFCCPPYALYQSQSDDMLGLIQALIERCPPGSRFLVEADERFDFSTLPQAEEWDVRRYSPAVIGLLCLAD